MPTLVHEISSPLAATLIIIPHNWAEGCTIMPRFSTQIAEAKSGLESRAPEFAIPRHNYRLRYLLNADEADELRARLETLKGSRLAVPLWFDTGPNDGNWSSWRIFSGPTITFDDDAGTYTIGGGAEAKKSSLLFCRLKGSASVEPVNGECSEISFEVFEDCPEAQAFSYNVVGGESPALPDPDWAEQIKETFRTQVQYDDIGQGREVAVRGDEASVKFGQRGGFHLSRSDARKFLRFWASKRGSWESFTMPVWYDPGDPENKTMRFAGDSFSMEFASQDVATVIVEFSEELDTIAGTPSQAASARAFLYLLQWKGASAVQRWTSWESALTFSSQAWSPQKIRHRNFKQTLSTKGDSIEIECDNFSGCPFRAFVLLELERELLVEVYECDPANAGDAVKIFSGSVAQVKTSGGTLIASCDQLGGAMHRKISRFFDQRACNFTLFSADCGVNPAGHTVSGTVNLIAGNVIDITCASTDADDYFSKGWARFGSGDTLERRYILRSELIGGGQRITLHKPIKQTGAIAVEFTPGCSGEFGAGGCAKFSNQNNFGGAPRKPAFIEQVATGYKSKAGK